MTMMPTSRCHESWRNEQFLGHFQSNSDSSRPRIRNAIIIALAFGVALPVAAEPFVCPNVVTLDITLTNSPNSDPCNNDGTIMNFGTMNTDIDDRDLDNRGGAIHNYGILNGDVCNEGELTNQRGGILTGRLGCDGNEHAGFTNFGVANIEGGTDDGGILNKRGGVLNVRSLIAQHNIVNESGGTINIIEGRLGESFTLENRLLNESGATLNNSGTLSSDDIIENHGMLNNVGRLELITRRGELLNFGVLTNTGTLENHEFFFNQGWLHTSGLIRNSNVLHNDGVIHITTTGSIVGEAHSSDIATLTQSGGSLINNGSIVQDSIDIQGGRMSGTGVWQVLTDSLNVGAEAGIEPGATDAPGKMTIVGDLVCGGCLIEIEIAGVLPGQFDMLTVDGMVTFLEDPTLLFRFIDGFAPTVGDHFDFLSAAAMESLSNVRFQFGGLEPGFLFDVVETSGMLTFTALNDGVSQRVPTPMPLTVVTLGVVLIGSGCKKVAQRDTQG